MKSHLRNTGWVLGLILLAMMIYSISIALSPINAVLPARAALPSVLPAAITNPQKAAILGAQTLLLTGSQTYNNYLPLLSR